MTGYLRTGRETAESACKSIRQYHRVHADRRETAESACQSVDNMTGYLQTGGKLHFSKIFWAGNERQRTREWGGERGSCWRWSKWRVQVKWKTNEFWVHLMRHMSCAVTKNPTTSNVFLHVHVKVHLHCTKANFFFDLCRCSMWTLNWILYEPIWKRCHFCAKYKRNLAGCVTLSKPNSFPPFGQEIFTAQDISSLNSCMNNYPLYKYSSPVLLVYLLWSCKCVLCYSFNHRLEWDFRRQGVAVVDDRVVIRSVPTIHCKTKPSQTRYTMNRDPFTLSS